MEESHEAPIGADVLLRQPAGFGFRRVAASRAWEMFQRQLPTCPAPAPPDQTAAAIALPTSVVVALPPMSGVRGADGSASTRSMAPTTAAAASA